MPCTLLHQFYQLLTEKDLEAGRVDVNASLSALYGMPGNMSALHRNSSYTVMLRSIQKLGVNISLAQSQVAWFSTSGQAGVEAQPCHAMQCK